MSDVRDDRGAFAMMNPTRRQTLAGLSVAAAAAALAGSIKPARVFAGPFEEENYLAVIPADKKLSPEWIKSLYERGQKQTYSDPKALRHIGMPVGGFFAGMVYLSGDGKLWVWDIFNGNEEQIIRKKAHVPGYGDLIGREGLNYLQPAPFSSPVENRFEIQIGSDTRTIDLDGFSEVTFEGRYPMATVSYRDPAVPVAVKLEAGSPFIPMNIEDSSLPATILSYTVTNTSDKPVTCRVSGSMANAVCLQSASRLRGVRKNRVVREDALSMVMMEAVLSDKETGPRRDPILFEDFEKPTYEGWTVEGTAFGAGPIKISDIPDYQGNVGGKGQRVVNSHASAAGATDVASRDRAMGKLISPEFTIERQFINLLVGGGAYRDKLVVEVLVDGKVIASAHGKKNNQMTPVALSVGKHQGSKARIQIIDAHGEGWGNIGVDHIEFSDTPAVEDYKGPPRDLGTMALAMLGESETDFASAHDGSVQVAEVPLDGRICGHVGRSVTLEPGKSATVTFVVAWHFPNLAGHGGFRRNQLIGNWYGSKFPSAEAVVRYIAGDFDRLVGQTRLWVATWYDSTLPYWVLDRTMANTSILATTTCYRHADGRYWAWEGVGCCPGTCTHVWHYAQAPGRLFPEMERDQRDRVDLGVGFDAQTGAIGMRAEAQRSFAVDGQCGRIIGVYREHQMSSDAAFLAKVWPRTKKAIEFIISRDTNQDGIVDGSQHNTLDADWFGEVSFLSSLYIAALRAGAAMAREMGDESFAVQCDTIAGRGTESMMRLFNGEYFIQIEDPNHLDKIGTGPGCYIDQIFGQTWAHWVGLGRLFDREKQLTALRSLWRYNFVPDVGPFREKFKQGRWYAAAGDAGLIMCSWPKGGKNPKFVGHWQYMYFNECMTGFEWQAAAHMIWEGIDQPDLLEHGLSVGRAIHDRYDASLRNPYNEVECSDHYSRAMASYGVFQALCGFNCHGPRGHVQFEPRLGAEDFKAAFTAAGGWGAYSQKIEAGSMTATLAAKWGKVKVSQVTVTLTGPMAGRTVASVATDRAAAQLRQEGNRVSVTLPEPVTLEAGQELKLTLLA